MKKLLLIFVLFFTLSSCKAQQGNFFWSYPTETLGYGALYNWYAVSNANFVPVGWHVPTSAEFLALESYLGGYTIAGGHLKEAGLIHWKSPNTGADNSTGFTAIGSGMRQNTGVFTGIHDISYMWSSTSYNSTYAWRQYVFYEDSKTYTNIDLKIEGKSVRLIKDDSTNPGTLTDYDGNVYQTIKIGNQVWIASNWKCTHLNDGTAIPNVTDNTTWAGLTTMGMCYYNNNPIYK